MVFSRAQRVAIGLGIGLTVLAAGTVMVVRFLRDCDVATIAIDAPVAGSGALPSTGARGRYNTTGARPGVAGSMSPGVPGGSDHGASRRNSPSPAPGVAQVPPHTGVAAGHTPSDASGAATSRGLTICVNTAGEAELQLLPHIGPALSARIVAYRNAHGPFRCPEDLLGVKGIGPTTVAELSPHIHF